MSQTISYRPSANRMVFTGNIVADATTFPTKNGEGVSFRIAHNQGRDEKPIFMDVVMYSGKDRAIPHDILKKGKYVKISGSYFEKEKSGNDGKVYTNRGIRAFEIEEVKPVVMEVSEDGKTATALDTDEDLPV